MLIAKVERDHDLVNEHEGRTAQPGRTMRAPRLRLTGRSDEHEEAFGVERHERHGAERDSPSSDAV